MGTRSKILLNVLIGLLSLVALYFFVQVVVKGDEVVIAEQGAGIVGPFVYYATALLMIVAGVTVLFSVVALFKNLRQ